MNNPTMGAMIASLRKERGMTQAQLAEQLNVTDKAVSKWERDIACPDISALPRLAELLGVSVDELLQVRQSTRKPAGENRLSTLLSTVFKAVALAMGVSVAVLSVMKQIDADSAIGMLGIGLACISLAQLKGNSAQ